MRKAAGPVTPKGMAKDMTDGFSAAEASNFSERTTHKTTKKVPFPRHLPSMFNFSRPYGFHWNNSDPEGKSHPESVPQSSTGDSGSLPFDHGHTGRGGIHGRFNPHARGGHLPTFHSPPDHPPPPPFRDPFGSDGLFGFRRRWNHHPKSPPPPSFEEEVTKTLQGLHEVLEKLHEARNQALYGEAGPDVDGPSRRESFGPDSRDHPGSGRGGYHQFYSGSGRGGYPQFNAHFHPPPPSWAAGHQSGGPPPRSAPPPRPWSAPAHSRAPYVPVFCVDIAAAWETYCAQWAKLISPSPDCTTKTTIKLSEIPWPIIVDTSSILLPSALSDKITAALVGEFILSPRHSVGIGHRKRIHHALRLYHPDRFEITVVAKVQEEYRKVVRELGETVA
ncbi:hypothetical protein FRB90_005537, partial [Tulasnella sp. 427]